MRAIQLLTLLRSRLGPNVITFADNESVLFSGPLGAPGMATGALDRAASPSGGGFAARCSMSGGLTSHQAYVLLRARMAYQIAVDVYVPTGSIATARLYDWSDGSWAGDTSTTKDQWVRLNGTRAAKSTDWYLGIGNNVLESLNGVLYYIDNLSVREIRG